ncbi:MAG: hypothetical protein U0Q16_27335 [Bryobacteraceae bacterium]
MIQNRVTVVFQPAGGSAADSIPAANRHVYIDVTAGTMTACRTNAAGLLTNTAGAPQPLDDARSYQVVTSATPLSPAPAPSSGVPVRVSGGRIALQPHIAIKVSESGRPAARLACTLAIGATSTPVTANANGWILSNDQAVGELKLSSATKLLKLPGSADPAVTIGQPQSISRGATARFTVNPPAVATEFRVTAWSYLASHTNPGPTASNPARTATINRPATEAQSTFSQYWEGTMCASGSLTVRFVVGVSLRASGNGAVAADVTAMDPIAFAADVSVDDRSWTTNLVENAEAPLTRAIQTFHDTGRHDWNSSAVTITPTLVGSGPNNGIRFASAATLTLTSSPFVNADVTNASSTFSQAQDKARMASPANVRNQVIPRQFYSVGAAGAITITDEPGLRTHFNLPTQAFSFTAHCISPADLLTGVQNHEYNHPNDKSHKGNCLKALRALEPVTFIEQTLVLPGVTGVDIQQRFRDRIQTVINAAGTHNIVDESQTQTDHVLRFVANDQIPAVNADSSGALIGPVWNPTTNTQLSN